MDTVRIMVVLPSLGGRLDSLKLALDSCLSLPSWITATVLVVLPQQATEARDIAMSRGAEVTDDPGLGMAGAINSAISARKDERYYIWLGDDDLLVGPGIGRAVELLERSSRAVIAFGHCEYIDEAGAVIGTNGAGYLAALLLPWGPNLIPHPGTVVSLDALEEVGGFSPDLSYALDLDVFLKLRKLGQFLSVRAVTAQFRWHADSLTVADRRASSREAMKVKASHLPAWIRPLALLWQWPVAWASALAAKAVTWVAQKKR